MYASMWVANPACGMKVMWVRASCWRCSTGRPCVCAQERSEQEHACWDPKDGELCLARTKPGETLVEVRRGSDVQIDRFSWAKGRKTNRTI